MDSYDFAVFQQFFPLHSLMAKHYPENSIRVKFVLCFFLQELQPHLERPLSPKVHIVF